MKRVLFLILLCYSGFAFGQKEKTATQYYNEGLIRFQNQEYKAADSLFTISDSLGSHVDTYFNLAITKKMLGDKCGYCINLKKASRFGDIESEKLFSRNCIREFTFHYKSDSNEFKNKTVFNLCRKDTTQFLYRIIKNDTTLVFASEANYNGFLMGIYEKKGKDSTEIFLNIDSIPLNLIYNRTAYGNFLLFKKANNKPYSSIPHVLSLVEKMPEFEGGEIERIKVLTENFVYPKEAKENGIQGVVLISFVINEDGSVSDYKIVRGIGGGCDEEALRVVKLMKNWKPGNEDGFPVKVQFNMPINFVLN